MDEPSSSLMDGFQSKMHILDALDRLMRDASFDKITVTEICTEAGISRATFYRYFKDKFAIPQWHLNFAYSRGANEIGRTLSWREGYYISEATVFEKRAFYTNVARSDDYNAIDNYAPRMRKRTIAATVTDFHKHPLTEHLRFQIDATVEMEVHLLPKWHYGMYDASLEELCAWMADIVPRELFKLLDTPLMPPSTKPVMPKPAEAFRSLI
ncbi:MAG: TetR/AcrR family transcriptional regulator [Gordonibacter sp.]|uniref:TetR/AcrR family transcriptional regulator n=1 Tax=Gordonibacter sp. TaxID=1968902 RepID=UPI002FC75734